MKTIAVMVGVSVFLFWLVCVAFSVVAQIINGFGYGEEVE
jgi:hypothetical protein